MLLLPFLLGFSTSLVILILNRLVDSVGVFFWRAQSDSAAASHHNRRRPKADFTLGAVAVGPSSTSCGFAPHRYFDFCRITRILENSGKGFVKSSSRPGK
jgi:hypothetical protein